MNDNLKAIMYTDGSADNMIKVYGYGAHGYVYNKDDATGKTSNKPNSYLVTDVGYLEPNESKIRPHVIVNPLYYLDMYASAEDNGTNNIAEVQSILDTTNELINRGITDILIYTDSKYAMHVINGSKEMTVLDINRNIDVNQILWLASKNLQDTIVEKKITFTLDKIKAHTGHLGNEMGDDLALLGRVESNRNKRKDVIFIETDAKVYWKSKYERHTFLNTKQIFFNPSTNDNSGVSMDYFILNYKNENEIGKRSHTAIYGYVLLKEKDPYIELVKDTFIEYLNGHSVPSTVRMDNLFKNENLKLIDMFNKKPLVMSSIKGKRNLTMLENDIIVNSINPPALAYKAFDDMENLKMIKDDYILLKSNPEHKSFREYIDITDLFYTLNDKNKMIIRPEIVNDNNVFNYEYSKNGKSAKIVIKLGADIITRNQLKRLEKNIPKVYLVIINNRDIKLDYFTLIDLEETGDLSVWANYYSNMVLLK